MAVILPAGSIATVVISDAQTSAGLNPQDVMNAVAAELTAEGYTVISTSQSGGLLSTITPILQETFQATYKVQVPYATDTDALGATILQAHADVSGLVSSVVSIPSYLLAGSSAAVATGQPGATPTTIQGIGNAISNAFSGFTSATKTVLISLAAIVILILVLIAYGPNVGRIAESIA